MRPCGTDRLPACLPACPGGVTFCSPLPVRRRFLPARTGHGRNKSQSQRARSASPPRLASPCLAWQPRAVSTRPRGISNTIAADPLPHLAPPTAHIHSHTSPSPIMVLAFSGLSLAKYVTSSPALMRLLKPVADAYARAAGYRKMGLRYDDLLIEENGTAQKVSRSSTDRLWELTMSAQTARQGGCKRQASLDLQVEDVDLPSPRFQQRASVASQRFRRVVGVRVWAL